MKTSCYNEKTVKRVEKSEFYFYSETVSEEISSVSKAKGILLRRQAGLGPKAAQFCPVCARRPI